MSDFRDGYSASYESGLSAGWTYCKTKAMKEVLNILRWDTMPPTAAAGHDC